MSKVGTKRLILLMILAAVLFVAAQNFDVILRIIGLIINVITPIILGACIAFIINVPMSFFERTFKGKLGFSKRRGLNAIARPLSLLISLIIVGFLVFMISGIIMPEVANTILSISNNVPTYINNIIGWSQETFQKYPQIAERLQNLQIDWKDIGNTLFQILQSGAQAILGSTVIIASNVVGGIISFFLSFVLSIYILFQKEKISFHSKQALRAFLPIKHAKNILKIATLTSKIFSRFLAGQCIEACILGTLVFICMSIFSFPYALMISVLIATLSFIPMFGIYVAAVFGSILIAFQDPLGGLLFFGMFVLIQQLEGNLIYPHVVGGSVGLSPIIVLVAIIVGGGLFGFVGMIVCVPISAVICALYKDFVIRRLEKRHAQLGSVSSDLRDDIDELQEYQDSLEKILELNETDTTVNKNNKPKNKFKNIKLPKRKNNKGL
ncbi:MAG TPA: AI-2E family transporter [Clostridiales bacterium]|nr:AI-2E family transporter [Clostridiales bacterium]